MTRKHLVVTLIAHVACATPIATDTSTETPTMQIEDVESENKRIVRRVYEECLNAGKMDVLPEIVATEFRGVNGETGASGFAATLTGIRSAFPDIHFAVEDLLAEGDRVVVRWRSAGTHSGTMRGIAPTGKHVDNSGISIYRLRDGQIVQAWLETDRLGFLQQVGVIPVDIVPGAPRPVAESSP
jgi:predicted ester cyclase